MQTLTAGSFLNLEKTENIEALKFTAKRLAEMTTAVAAAENLNAEALKNLANDLWQKADYVARETERRSLREIFVENFCEAFHELKPEVSPLEIATVEVQENIQTVGNNGSTEQSSETTESVLTPALPEEDRAAEAQEKKDEFLGFVKTDEPFVVTNAAETNTATAAIQSATEETEQETIQSASENKPLAGEKVSTGNPNETKPQSTAATAAEAKSNPQSATSAVKTGATVAKSADAAKEPFEFGKCTVNFNLTLLPASSGDGSGRRAIISAASHGSPPEIEFLEIGEGENLVEIAALVKDKLERFKQTLPAKYIEQLRASKTKSAKKAATAKPAAQPAPATTKPEIKPAIVEKTSGEQNAQNGNGAEADKNRTENVATKENLAAQPAPVPQVAAANNVQPSLF